MSKLSKKLAHLQRTGAVAVEFAVVAPVLLAIVFGLVEITRIYDMQNLLEMAAREGTRFAAMDRSTMLHGEQTANEKMIADTRNFLTCSGISPGDVTISVVDHENPGTAFDIGLPENNLKLFRLEISIPYSDITPYANLMEDIWSSELTVSFVSRNGRTFVAQ